MTTTMDPITFELLRNALGSIVDEMALTICRTAHSGVLKDNMDFSTAFCDARGRMIAQGLTLPLHLGSLPDAMEAIVRDFGADPRPGDIYMMNDPFDGGMHLPDVFIVKPVFAESRLAGFATTVAHQTDMGGRVAGSNASDSTEIFAEGLRIPPLKFYDRGEPNVSLWKLIEKNVRMPDRVLGDMQAQVTACRVAERQYLALVERYGPATLERFADDLLDYSERQARAEIASWPDGVYTFADWIDEDGFDPDPIPLRVAVTVRGDELTADFTGSSPQVKGAINATFSFTKSAVYLAVRAAMRRQIPNNAGFFRPITVVAPPASILNPVLPAACAARGLTGFRTADLVLGALSQVVPERIPAACEGGNTGVSIGGWSRERRPFIFVEFVCGTWGGRPDRDGVDGVTSPSVCMANTPAEIVELEQPIAIDEYGFAPDTGGAGKYRGGLSLVRTYRFTGDEAVLQVRADRRRFRPYGLAGGQPGTPSENTLNPETERRLLPSKLTMTIRKGDVFRHVQASGGGYGDPLDRDPDLVQDDVLNEKLSVERARDVYGVALDPETLAVDVAATARLRGELVRLLAEGRSAFPDWRDPYHEA